MNPATESAPAASVAAGVAPASAGFADLRDEVDIASLPLSGQLPAWLTGSLVRVAPAQWDVGERTLNHWFDGFAMLHRFQISDGRVSYANRFLQTDSYRAARDSGKIEFSEFASDPCRSMFKRVQSMFSPKLSDNTNVNLTRLGERYIAMTETPIAVQFDARTLETAGVAYEAPGQLSTAHPHGRRGDGAMLNYAARLGPRNQYRFFVLAPGARVPQLVGSLPVSEPAYMHSFGLTERFFVLAEFPFTVNTFKLATSGRPYIENYTWHPERPTRFQLIDRDSGELVHVFETDACFAFHHVNAYELGTKVIVDLCVFEDASIITELYLGRLRSGGGVESLPYLERFELDIATGAVTRERISDASIDLPRINYARSNERPYRYAWGTGLDGASGWFDEIVMVDVQERTAARWSEPGCYPGEPVFVAAPDAQEENEGVLLSVVFDAGRGTSFMLVLDARTLSELARAEVPHHIPFGFHGQFTRS
jgi:carotenoid cleavage dioxygenase-like enzyme